MVGHNLSRGKLSDNVMETGPMLAGAGATADVVDCLFAEARRKRPSEQLISGYAFILQSALDSLRLNMNGGAPQAREEIEEVRQEVANGLSRGGLPPAVLMLVAKAFVEAQLDPGRALQEAMMDAMETEGNVDGSAMDPQAMSDELAKVAKALDDDPFAIHAEIYPAHPIIRNSFGSMTRKLSVTWSHHSCQFAGTSSRRKVSIATLNSLKVA